MMRSSLAILLLASFAALTVFGFSDMRHEAGQSHDATQNKCIATMMQSTDCPPKAAPIDFAAFHLDAFKIFSLATFGENLLAMLPALVLLVVGVGMGIAHGNTTPLRVDFAYAHTRGHEFLPRSFRYEFAHWFALHENSPAIG